MGLYLPYLYAWSWLGPGTKVCAITSNPHAEKIGQVFHGWWEVNHMTGVLIQIHLKGKISRNLIGPNHILYINLKHTQQHSIAIEFRNSFREKGANPTSLNKLEGCICMSLIKLNNMKGSLTLYHDGYEYDQRAYSSPSFERPPLEQVQKWSYKAGGLSMEVQ